MSKYVESEYELKDIVTRNLDALSPEQLQALADTRAVKLELVETARRKMGWPTVGTRNGRKFMIK